MSMAELHRAITRGMRHIEAMRPAIDLDGFTAPQAEALEMLAWMSWQPLHHFSEAVQEALPLLEAQGLVELRSITGGRRPTHARLAVAKQGGPA